jgi:8-oxo-dGTP diphosphatase
MPEATVVAIVVACGGAEGRVLLTRRNVEPFKDRWCLPGGHIDRYEPAREAVIREVREETGLEFDARFLGYVDEIICELGIHAVAMVFEGCGTGVLDPPPEEVTEAGWFGLSEARALPLAFTHNEILDAYARQAVDGERAETA